MVYERLRGIPDPICAVADANSVVAMATTAQITANQINATHSTGPRTAESKHTSSQNARTHGLTSTKSLLTSEELPEYERLRAGLAATWEPKTDEEHRLLEALAQNAWRMARVREQEASFFNRCAAALRQADPKLSYEDAVSEVFINPQYASKLKLFLRYQTSIERAYYKSQAELERALKARYEWEQLQRDVERRKRQRETREAQAPMAMPSPTGFVSHADLALRL